MSKLYVSATSDTIKTERTARGHHYVKTHARTWEAGVSVSVQTDTLGNTYFVVCRTGGSTNPSDLEKLASFVLDSAGQIEVTS